MLCTILAVGSSSVHHWPYLKIQTPWGIAYQPLKHNLSSVADALIRILDFPEEGFGTSELTKRYKGRELSCGLRSEKIDFNGRVYTQVTITQVFE